MKDYVHALLKFIDYNRYTVAAAMVFIVTLALAVSLAGCQATTPALLTDTPNAPAPKVSRAEFERQALLAEKDLTVKRLALNAQIDALNAEIQTFNQRLQAGLDDLNRQDEFRAQLLDTLSVAAANAAGGTLNPVALIPIGFGLLGSALGLGAAADNRRKDALIQQMKKAV